MMARPSGPTLAYLLEHFFCQRLQSQGGASPETVACYRDAFRLLLRYAAKRKKRLPAALTLADLNATTVLNFLDHLEKHRANAVRSRNARLAAIRSFMRFASLHDPASLHVIQRVLAIPLKRWDRPLVGFLQKDEVQAIIDAPAAGTWSGARDRVMFATFYNTGARVSEIAALHVADIRLARSPHVCIHGKGRKERIVPLWKSTSRVLKEWLTRVPRGTEAPAFPNRNGEPLTRSGIEYRLKLAVRQAAQTCSTLRERRVSPHTLRHTTAMHLLQSGVDINVIALWLGHESPLTTHTYLEANVEMRERALRKLREPKQRSFRYKADDQLLAFLDRL